MPAELASWSRSTPCRFPSLIPKESLGAIDDQLNVLRADFRAEVLGFENIYSEARRQAHEMLGELFDDADYPVDILPRFRFSWRFLSMEVPGRSTLLSPEIYEREKQKWVGSTNRRDSKPRAPLGKPKTIIEKGQEPAAGAVDKYDILKFV